MPYHSTAESVNINVTSKFHFPQESATFRKNLPFAPPACRMLEPHRVSQSRWIGSPAMAVVTGNMVMLATPKSVRPTMKRRIQRSTVGLRNPCQPNSIHWKHRLRDGIASRITIPTSMIFYVFLCQVCPGQIDAVITPSQRPSASVG